MRVLPTPNHRFNATRRWRVRWLHRPLTSDRFPSSGSKVQQPFPNSNGSRRVERLRGKAKMEWRKEKKRKEKDSGERRLGSGRLTFPRPPVVGKFLMVAIKSSDTSREKKNKNTKAKKKKQEKNWKGNKGGDPKLSGDRRPESRNVTVDCVRWIPKTLLSFCH